MSSVFKQKIVTMCRVSMKVLAALVMRLWTTYDLHSVQCSLCNQSPFCCVCPVVNCVSVDGLVNSCLRCLPVADPSLLCVLLLCVSRRQLCVWQWTCQSSLRWLVDVFQWLTPVCCVSPVVNCVSGSGLVRAVLDDLWMSSRGWPQSCVCPPSTVCPRRQLCVCRWTCQQLS